MQQRTVDVGGRGLHLRTWGQGPDVLLVHGIPTSGELWRDVAPRLAARARVLAPDLLGYGQSDPPEGRPLGVEAQTGYLLSLLDALGIQRATVVGHDIGGAVAQLLATEHPQRVERLGLINCAAYDNWPVPEMRALQIAAPVAEHLPAGLTTAALERGLLRGFLHRERGQRYLERFFAPFSTTRGLHVFMDHVRALDSAPTERIAPLLSRLSIPVAVAWGRHDPFLEPKWAERLASDIPTAELTWVEASHFSPADAPDAVAEALLRLLER